jgi:hypothetical protein
MSGGAVSDYVCSGVRHMMLLKGWPELFIFLVITSVNQINCSTGIGQSTIMRTFLRSMEQKYSERNYAHSSFVETWLHSSHRLTYAIG